MPPQPPPAIAEPTPADVTIIGPASGWQFLNLAELWRYRELVCFLAWRDIKVRYQQTLLGAAWAVLQPALMMVVFTLFFNRMGGLTAGALPYPLFVYAGLLPWTFFATAVSSAGNSIVGSERLITKVYFPRLVVPFAAVAAALVDFLIALGLLVVLVVGYALAGVEVLPGPALLLAPVIFLGIALAAAGVGTLLAALNVAYRDFRHVIPFLLQLWLFATPSVYLQTAGGEAGLARLLALNPMTGLVAAFRAAVLGGPLPWTEVGISSVAAVVLFLAGCCYFRNVEDSFADTI